jgi:nucleoside-diphosphate-sugar epimerase
LEVTERITVLGGAGFVGSALVAALQSAEREVVSITRENISTVPEDLGHAIYAIGLTSDFRNRTLETITAHVTLLADLIAKKSFDSFTYLSSTRLYRSEVSTDEAVSIAVSSRDPDDIYTLSKLLGEAILLRLVPDRGRICRLSNVYGGNDRSQNFLTSILSSARKECRVNIMQAAASEKDYLHVEDACSAIEIVALHGTEPIYNVAAGENISHRQIANVLTSNGVSVNFGGSELVQFKPINIKRLGKLIDWKPRRLVDDLPQLLSDRSL